MSTSEKSSPAVLFLIIAFVNLGNYMLNLGLGRLLGPAEFAEAGILSTLVLVLSFIAVGIQITFAKFVAQICEEGGEEESVSFLRWAMKWAFIAGCTVSIVLLVTVMPLQAFLKFSRPLPLIILMAGIPVYFVMSVQRGYLQGLQQFKSFSVSYIAEMAGRLGITAILAYAVVRFQLPWMSEAVSAGFLASFATACLASTPVIRSTAVKRYFSISRKAILRFLLVTLFYEFSQIIISYSDTILVKHYYNDHTAGLYTALSMIGKMVYFATWSVVMLLIPKVVMLESKGEDHSGLFLRYFLFVCSGGAFITFICALMPVFIVQILFGEAFLSIAPMLWKYAAATTLFAAANVFAYYYISMGRYIPVVLSAIAGVAQVVMIVHFHAAIESVIHIQIVVMTALLTTMVSFHLLNKSSYEKTEISTGYALSTK